MSIWSLVNQSMKRSEDIQYEQDSEPDVFTRFGLINTKV